MLAPRSLLAFLTTGTTIIMALAPINAAVAQRPYFHRQRTSVNFCMPKYNYGHDSRRFSARGLAVADAVQGRVWHDENFVPVQNDNVVVMQKPGLSRDEPLLPPLETYVPRSLESRNGLARPVQRKPFHFTQASLTVYHIKLEQIGLSIYDTGHIATSGRITHYGGPDGGLAGNNVTIRLLAYAAPVDQIGQLPINSPLVWQAEHKLWVSRGPSQVIPLTTQRNLRDPELRRYFDEITHLEVELEYQEDR